jgi:putative component of toxin-antitoxin plasmid stabilization module
MACVTAKPKPEFLPVYVVWTWEIGDEIMVLLAGGDKSTQDRDIKQAIDLANTLRGTA